MYVSCTVLGARDTAMEKKKKKEKNSYLDEAPLQWLA